MPSKASSDHPLYIEMIKAAIEAIKDRKGASKQAILKYIKENYTVKDNVGVCVKMTLKRNVESGKLVQTTGVGSNGRFKLPSQKPTKKPAQSNSSKKSPAKSKPKQAAKKSPAKKKSPKKSPSKKSKVTKKSRK